MNKVCDRDEYSSHIGKEITMDTQKEQEQYAGDVEFELTQLEMILEDCGVGMAPTYNTGGFLTIICC